METKPSGKGSATVEEQAALDRIKKLVDFKDDAGYLSSKKIEDPATWNDFKIVGKMYLRKGEEFFRAEMKKLGLSLKHVERLWNELNSESKTEATGTKISVEANKTFSERLGIDALDRPDRISWEEAHETAVKEGFDSSEYVKGKADARSTP